MLVNGSTTEAAHRELTLHKGGGTLRKGRAQEEGEGSRDVCPPTGALEMKILAGREHCSQKGAREAPKVQGMTPQVMSPAMLGGPGRTLGSPVLPLPPPFPPHSWKAS